MVASDWLDPKEVLRHSRLFGGLGGASLDRMAALVRTGKIKSAKALFHRGDPPNGCYFILDGAMKVCLPGEDGEETFLAVVGRGDIVGEMGLVDRQPRSASVIAIKDCTVGHISNAEFERIADADTEIYRHLLRVLSGRIRASNEAVEMQQLPLPNRLARVLIRLSDGFGEKLPDGRILIRQKFSQTDLGRMTGSARENVNRQLSVWKRDDVLTTISGYYCIGSLATLRQLAGLDGG